MTNGGDIAADQPFARAWEMLQRLWLLITCAVTNPSLLEARFAEIEAEVARGILRKLKATDPAFADIDEATLLMTWRNGRYDFGAASPSGPAWDARAFGRQFDAWRKQRIERHRASTVRGRFYKRRRHAIGIACIERRFSAPRRQKLVSRARASIPFVPVNLAPP